MSVLAEIRAGDRLSMAGVARLFLGRLGRETLHPSTVSRWATVGVYPAGEVGHPGKRVKLEVARCGSALTTSFAAVERFAAALAGSAFEGPAPRTPTQRNRASERAAAELAAAGA